MEASSGGPEGSREKPAEAVSGADSAAARAEERGAAERLQSAGLQSRPLGLSVEAGALRLSVLGRCRSFHISQQGSEKYLSRR